MKRSCNTCNIDGKDHLREKTGWLSTLLVVILPKCPFCIVAYSSAITVCGASGVQGATNDPITYLPLLFAIIVPVMLMLNYRDKRTFLAVALSIFGIILIGQTLSTPYNSFYWIGSTLLILSVWINSSLLSFLSRLSKKRIGLNPNLD